MSVSGKEWPYAVQTASARPPSPKLSRQSFEGTLCFVAPPTRDNFFEFGLEIMIEKAYEVSSRLLARECHCMSWQLEQAVTPFNRTLYPPLDGDQLINQTNLHSFWGRDQDSADCQTFGLTRTHLAGQ